MPTIYLDRKEKERLDKLGNVSASVKVSVLLDLCEKYWAECISEIVKRSEARKHD